MPQYDNEVSIEFAVHAIMNALQQVMIGPVTGGTAKLLAPVLCAALIEGKIPYTKVITRQRHARSSRANHDITG